MHGWNVTFAFPPLHWTGKPFVHADEIMNIYLLTALPASAGFSGVMWDGPGSWFSPFWNLWLMCQADWISVCNLLCSIRSYSSLMDRTTRDNLAMTERLIGANFTWFWIWLLKPDLGHAACLSFVEQHPFSLNLLSGQELDLHSAILWPNCTWKDC